MPLSNPSGSLKKQLDSAVIEEANKEVSKLSYNERRWEAKLHFIRKLRTIVKYAAEHCFKYFLCHSAFSEAMMLVLFTCMHLRCLYILGLVWANARETRSSSQPQMFSSELDLILHPRKFSTMQR